MRLGTAFVAAATLFAQSTVTASGWQINQTQAAPYFLQYSRNICSEYPPPNNVVTFQVRKGSPEADTLSRVKDRVVMLPTEPLAPIDCTPKDRFASGSLRFSVAPVNAASPDLRVKIHPLAPVQ